MVKTLREIKVYKLGQFPLLSIKYDGLHCEFINLVNKTNIYELAQVLRNCKALVSVNTGTITLVMQITFRQFACFTKEKT